MIAGTRLTKQVAVLPRSAMEGSVIPVSELHLSLITRHYPGGMARAFQGFQLPNAAVIASLLSHSRVVVVVVSDWIGHITRRREFIKSRVPRMKKVYPISSCYAIAQPVF